MVLGTNNQLCKPEYDFRKNLKIMKSCCYDNMNSRLQAAIKGIGFVATDGDDIACEIEFHSR